MTGKRNNRGRSSRGGNSRRLPANLRHEVAVTITKYVPPIHPRPREAAFKVRRVLQSSQPLTQDPSAAGVGLFDLLPKIFFNTQYSTTGFEMFFLHRVSIWSGVVVPGTGQTVFPTIIAYHNFPAGTSLYPDMRGTAGAYNERARVGYYVPSHLSGPFLANDTKAFVSGKVYNENTLGTFPVKTITVEIDATFC